MAADITQFRGDYDFLSNFSNHRVFYEGVTWRTSEHAYQAMKTLLSWERYEIAAAEYPGKAKKLGGNVTVRPDWDDVKVGLMLDIVTAKFLQNPDLIKRLLATGTAKLIEGNFHHDRFWGVDANTGEGRNWLGRILMGIRDGELYFE